MLLLYTSSTPQCFCSLSLPFWECISFTSAHLSPTPTGMHWFVIARSLVIKALDMLVYCRVVPGFIVCLLFCYYSAEASFLQFVAFHTHPPPQCILFEMANTKIDLGFANNLKQNEGKGGYRCWKWQPPCPAWLLWVFAIFSVVLE